MDFKNANFPMTDQGRTYHLNLKLGELSNKILTVGDHQRATLISKLFDTITHTMSSKRGFLTITGTYKNELISVVGIGMGISMMDFFVREARAVVEGAMYIIRLGSCGSISSTRVGDVIVCESAILVQRNPNAFSNGVKDELSFTISNPFESDKSMTRKV